MTLPNETMEKLGVTFVREKRGIKEFTLTSNGLQILLLENHIAPVVTSMVVYRVGSRNEGVGYTGSTHFLEHLMFKSTARYNHAAGTGIDDMLKPTGALYNASTGEDSTDYYECVPREKLALCLSIEADRMRNLVLKEHDRATEMTVVRSEFEISENDIDEVLDKELMAEAIREHPYHHPVIGWRSDVEGVPLERLSAFYNTFYWPNNATLIVIGDFDLDATLTLIAQEFGHIPASPAPIPAVYTVEPPQEGERRFEVRRAGQEIEKLAIGFRSAAAAHPNYIVLDVIRDLLGHEDRQSSRLYKALMDGELAASVETAVKENRDPSLFVITAVPSEGTSLDTLEAAILAEVSKLASEPVPASELERVKLANRNGSAALTDDPIEYAEQLCTAIAIADWTWLVDYDDLYEAVTPADIQRVAQAYLTRNNRTVGRFIPKESTGATDHELLEDDSQSASAAPGAPEETADTHEVSAHETLVPESSAGGDAAHAAGAPESSGHGDANHASGAPERSLPGTSAQQSCGHESTADAASAAESSAQEAADLKPSDERALVPAVQEDGGSGTSFARRVTRKVLPNGLTLLVMPIAGSGVVSVSGKIRAGAVFAPAAKATVPILTAEMLTGGSLKFTKTQIGEALEQIGTELSFDTNDFTVDFNSTLVATELEPYLKLAGDLLLFPAFTGEELTRCKQELSSIIKEEAGDTEHLARVRLFQTLYKRSHPYYEKSGKSLLRELPVVSAEDLKAFYKEHYSPKSTILSIVGDVDCEQAAALVTAIFGEWSGAEAKPIKVAPVTLPDAAKRIDVKVSDKASVDILIAVPASLTVHDPDFRAASIADAALGLDTLSSRLGQVVREQNGLTYGITTRFQDPSFGWAPWLIKLSVNPANIEKALALVNKVLDDYRENGLTAKELADEAGRLYGLSIVQLRTTSGIAKKLSEVEFLGLGLDSVDNVKQSLNAVTLDAANAALRKYFRRDVAVTVVAGSF